MDESGLIHKIYLEVWSSTPTKKCNDLESESLGMEKVLSLFALLIFVAVVCVFLSLIEKLTHKAVPKIFQKENNIINIKFQKKHMHSHRQSVVYN